jgi:hypothetical protein|tara:strand:- start:1103 stop:1603 length:501 start_codon:yes stop_codon:yes gene_type:complete
MSYTENIKHDELCNYLDFSKDNSQKMLLNCINQVNKKNIVKLDKGSVNGSQIIEGFASDLGIDSGVSYIPHGECPVGHTKLNNKCLKVCSHCKYTDKRGFFGNQINMGEHICGGPGLFNGVDDHGFVKCIPEKGATDNNLTNSINRFYNVDSSFTKKNVTNNCLFL